MICVKCGAEVPELPFCGLCCWKQTEPVRTRTRRSNGEGRVWKRGRSWYAQVTLYSQAEIVNGKKIYRQKKRTKGGFATKRDALEYLSTLRSSAGRRTPTLLELWTMFEKNDLPKLSESKKSAYKKARERLDGLIGRRIDTLTVSELQELVDREAFSYYTARDIKTLLSHLYKKAMPDGYVTQNLSAFLVLPELDEKEAEPFTGDEVQKLWSAFAGGDTFIGYLLLMIYTGMMPGELFACRKDMIDYDRLEIFGCGKKTKKRKKEVPIVFPAFIAPVLQELAAASPKDKLVPLYETEWYDAYHEAVRRAGVRDLPPYSCRHTTGTEAARLNLSAPVIQTVMRHSKITTTQKYIHLGSDSAHSAVNQLPGDKNSSDKAG